MTFRKAAFFLRLAASLFPVCAIAQPADAPAAAPAPAEVTILRHIVLAESLEAGEKVTPASTDAFVTLSPALAAVNINPRDLGTRLAAGRNQPIHDRLLVGIAQVIEAAVKADFPLATVLIPPQKITAGTLRVVVVLGKIREIKFQGNRWFSDALLRQKLHIDRGEIVQISELDRAITFTNNNPFRFVRVHIDPIPNTNEANLVVGVAEKMPMRVFASVDNGGNPYIGETRIFAGATYANVWGRDHEATYQFITTDKPKFYQGHGLSYTLPFASRHRAQFNASYAKSQPELLDGLLIQDGESLSLDARYAVPLRTGNNPVEAYASVAFKQTNNALEYGITQVLGTKTNIFQLTLGGSMIQRDKRGVWAFGASVTASPGGINSRNTNVAFDGERYADPTPNDFTPADSARLGAKAAYIYGSLSAQRLLNLAHGWDWVARASLQLSQGNLLPSEQMGIGGASSVRGYPENVFNGDNGFTLSNDWMTPAWKKALPRLSKNRGPLETRGLVFFDVGDVGAHRAFGEPKRTPLAGVGVGLRMSLGMTFSLSADYGWQIADLPRYAANQERAGRGHIKAMLAF